MKQFCKYLLILYSCIFYHCKNTSAGAENEVGTEMQALPEKIVQGFWLGDHPVKKGEILVLECTVSPPDVLLYNYNAGAQKCQWRINNSNLEFYAEGNEEVLMNSLTFSDSVLQMNTSQNRKIYFRKTEIAKKENFEFAGMLNGLSFEDQEIVLEYPAYLFVHSAINDSIVQFNVFGQAGKKITTIGTTNYGGILQKGTYFIRAFQRRDLEEAIDKAAFNIEFTLMHTDK